VNVWFGDYIKRAKRAEKKKGADAPTKKKKEKGKKGALPGSPMTAWE